ncbi:MAG: amidohydrolase family protein, partial [Bdellovibrionales bacterium]|nr:amidohydrolase family protein [Bdellovibrionales bacterium]
IWRDETSALLATQNALRLAKKNSRPVHILHVSTAEEMDLLARHKDIATVEVTPQHLTLNAPECYEKLGTFAQMNPPIRSKHHQEALWKALKAGVVDVMGSDHAPHTIEEKQGTYPNTPSGMPGVQTLAPIMLNHASKGRLSYFDINRLLAVNPARIWRLIGRGFIHPGFEATFSIFDLKRTETVTAEWLKSKCGWSPFEGDKFTGWPIHSLIRGEFVLKNETLVSRQGRAFKFEL